MTGPHILSSIPESPPNSDTEYNTDDTQLFPEGLPGRDYDTDTSVLKKDDNRYRHCTVKSKKFRYTKKIAVIILKVEQCGLTIQ